MHTMGYITRSLTKAQKKGKSQVSSKSKVTNKSDYNLKSPFVIHLRGTFQSSATNLNINIDKMPTKHQQSCTSKHASKHAKILEQFEKSAKLVKLYFINKDGLEAQVSQKAIEKILTKNSVFGTLSLKLHTILKVLQEFNQLAKKNNLESIW